LLLGGVLGLVLGAASGLLRTRTWTASVSFTAQSGDGTSSRIAGLAAQFGVAVPNADRSQSPEYFAELVRSGRVLGDVADLPLSRAGDEAPGRLADLLEIEADDDVGARREKVIEELEKRIRTSTGLRTGVVRVTVRMPEPQAAVSVASSLVERANAVAVQMRQQQATVERQYAERQVRELERRLSVTEDSLLRFSRANREYINESPLSFTRARLARSVDLQRSVLTSVIQSVEQARLSAVRDTPNLTVVDPPRLPVKPDGRGTVIRGLLGLMVGLLLAFTGTYLSARRRR
jgi:uncharacterized protein involved in exopolysaccharide biosynthesis